MSRMKRVQRRSDGEQLIGVLLPAVIVRPTPPPAPLPTLASPRLPARRRLLIDATHLDEHGRYRGAVLPTDGLLRYRDGGQLTSRRYDRLWKRIGEQLPWVAAQGISTHWLRHTTLTWVERHFGYGIARAYAGHTDSVGPATTTYIKAVATALAAMTARPHPLAT